MRLRAALLVALFAMLAAVPLTFASNASATTSVLVMIDNYAFAPSSLTITAGTTVTWTNHDVAPHDVTTTSAPVAIHSATMTTGHSFTYTFTTPGTYTYICSIHPDMRATLVVKAVVVKAAPAAPRTTVATHVSHPTTAAMADLHSKSRSASKAAAVPVIAKPSATPTLAAAAPAASAAAPEPDHLRPMLLVAGVIAAVATLCLLMLFARPERSELS